jgi:hypothetical protein
MARRFPSFLTVESKLNGSLKINEHLIESYLDIIFLLLGYLICARRQHYYRFFCGCGNFWAAALCVLRDRRLEKKAFLSQVESLGGSGNATSSRLTVCPVSQG